MGINGWFLDSFIVILRDKIIQHIVSRAQAFISQPVTKLIQRPDAVLIPISSNLSQSTSLSFPEVWNPVMYDKMGHDDLDNEKERDNNQSDHQSTNPLTQSEEPLPRELCGYQWARRYMSSELSNEVVDDENLEQSSNQNDAEDVALTQRDTRNSRKKKRRIAKRILESAASDRETWPFPVGVPLKRARPVALYDYNPFPTLHAVRILMQLLFTTSTYCSSIT